MKDLNLQIVIMTSYNDLANSKFDQQENGYKTARQEAYGSIADQLDMHL